MIPKDPEEFEDWISHYFKVEHDPDDEYLEADQARDQMVLVLNEMLDLDIEAGSPISDVLYYGAGAATDAARNKREELR